MKYWQYYLCVISVIAFAFSSYLIYRHLKEVPKAVRKAAQEGSLIVK